MRKILKTKSISILFHITEKFQYVVGMGKDNGILYEERTNIMEQIPESKFEGKRSNVIEELVAQNVFKINGRQLYELSLYELMKEYTQKSLSS